MEFICIKSTATVKFERQDHYLIESCKLVTRYIINSQLHAKLQAYIKVVQLTL